MPNQKTKSLLRFAETYYNIGNIEEAKENIYQLKAIIQSDKYENTSETHKLYTVSAAIAWRLELYELAIELGASALETLKISQDNSESLQLKYLLNLIYYRLENWDNSKNKDFTVLQEAINGMKQEVDDANNLLEMGAVANASMYDSLSWFYYHVAIFNFELREFDKSQQANQRALEYNRTCIITWTNSDRSNEDVPRSIWLEHGKRILELSKKLKEFPKASNFRLKRHGKGNR